jgi:Nif-specific ferredoxin III
MELLTRDGRSWVPEYLIAIDQGKCIGCGRCFKVCGRGVMSLKGMTDEGELLDIGADADDDDDEEFERKVMTVADAGNCIGCGACGRVCAKGCQTHSSAPPAIRLAA